MIREFQDSWDLENVNRVITDEEFIDYYRVKFKFKIKKKFLIKIQIKKDLNANIDKDDYFEVVIYNAWGITK